jgi:DNA-binding MarR family transcriptional regulator
VRAAIRETRALTALQMDVLDTMAGAVDLSAREIATELGLSRSAAYKVIGRCVDAGLLEAVPLERVGIGSRLARVLYSITETGRAELRLRLANGRHPGVSWHQRSTRLPTAWIGTLRTPLYRRILAALAQGPTTRRQIAELFDRRRPLSYRLLAARDKLFRLKDYGLADPLRKGRNATWTITPRGLAALQEVTS